MRIATLGSFAAGLACGVLVVGIGVWYRGAAGMVGSTIPAAQSQPLPQPLPLDQATLPPPPPVSAPPAGTPPTARGDADRSVDAGRPALRLALPLDTLKASALAESFYDKRDGRSHEAIDIPAPRGTPVRAVAEGNVAKLFTSKQGGLTVYQFDNTQTYCFYYAHLDKYAPGIQDGMLLRKGEVLGYVGTTGNAPKNTPHLHFALFQLGPDKKWWSGKPLDPLPFFK
jgi:murein DD-endopeptidase MepM/ murein hydrolase activator NlpD